MKNKQIVGIVVAALAFVFVCASSAYVKSWNAVDSDKNMGGIFSYLEGMTEVTGNLDFPEGKFVGIVRVEGTIGPSQSSSVFQSAEGYDHNFTMNYIEQLMGSADNAGILLYVDSPGGTVYEADELYLKLMEYKEETGRPVVAYFASEACSGGYYISMAADKIYANRNNWTGSIGVIISMVNYKDLLDKWGIKKIDIASGKNKAMGSAGGELTEEQRAILQGLVDEAYEQFVGIVAEGRNLSVDKVKELADGRIYSAKQAYENKLIDQVGTYEEVMDALREMTGSGYMQYYEPTQEGSWLSDLFSAYQESISKSDAQVLSEVLKERGKGGLMYYAETGR